MKSDWPPFRPTRAIYFYLAANHAIPKANTSLIGTHRMQGYAVYGGIENGSIGLTRCTIGSLLHFLFIFKEIPFTAKRGCFWNTKWALPLIRWSSQAFFLSSWVLGFVPKQIRSRLDSLKVAAQRNRFAFFSNIIIIITALDVHYCVSKST